MKQKNTYSARTDVAPVGGPHIIKVIPLRMEMIQNQLRRDPQVYAYYSYEDDCSAACSEHGDAANAYCGVERDYESRPSRTLLFRSRLVRPLPLGLTLCRDQHVYT